MMSEENFEYLSSCHISNRYENTAISSSKTTSLVSLQADFQILVTVIESQALYHLL